MWSARPSATWVTCLRALARAFAAADVICCEDTRVTSKLLMHLAFPSRLSVATECDRRARRRPWSTVCWRGDRFASDAGMPSVSDPGQALVEAAREGRCPLKLFPAPSACVSRRSFRPVFPGRAFFFGGLFGP